MVAAALFLTNLFSLQLILTDARTGEVYARFPVEEGTAFEIGFVHSVNKSPLIDCYEIRDGHILVVRTVYYGFGAGVESELHPGETLTYNEDGAMVVSGFSDNDRCGGVKAISTVSDHWLTIGGETISLRDTIGAGKQVRFDCEYAFRFCE